MTAPLEHASAAGVPDDTEGITELEKFDPTRVDGVTDPANGFPILMLKSISTTPADDVPATTPQEGHITAVTTEPASPDTAVEADTSPPAPVTKASENTVTVELPADVSVSFSPADLAKLNTFKRRLILEQAASAEGDVAKRDFDPNVGGGVDRDKLKSSDFVFGDERAFPVVKPGDVMDAVHSWGRYKGGKSFDQFKAKLTALAHRKGQSFVDELPDEWTKPGGAKKAGAKDCPECGKNYHADSKQRTCENCGHDLPAADDGDAAKAKKPKGGNGKKKKPWKGEPPFEGASPPYKEGNTGHDAPRPGPPKDKQKTKAAKDAGGYTPQPYHADPDEKVICPKCGKHDDVDAKYCDQCGFKLAGAQGVKVEKTKKSAAGKTAKAKTKKPFPADAKVDAAIARLKTDADAALAAQNADPDAATHPADRAVSEALERVKDDVEAAAAAQDKDEQTDTAAQHTAKGADDGPAYHLARLHDATCAAYHHDDVTAAHPLLTKGLAALADPTPFAAMVTAALTEDAGTGSRMAELPSLSAAYHCAVAMKAAAAHDGLLDAAMDDLRKAFADMYPDAHPKPGSITPGSFKRPYIATGRAKQSAKPGQKPRIPLASHVPSPDDFRRPLITAGREAASPGSKPSGVGKNRMYYSNDGKGQAAAVLASMHDWIADQHPTICPMKGAPFDNEPGVDVNSMGSSLTSAQPMPKRFAGTQAAASPVPVGAGHAASVVTPGPTRKNKADKAAAKEERKMAKRAKKAAAAATASAPLIDPEMLKSILGEVVAGQIGELKTTLGEHEKRIAEWESAPDPAQMTPRNGAAALGKAREKSHEVPAGGDGPSTQRILRLAKQTRDPDGGVRVTAIGELTDLIGREKAAEILAATH